MEINGCDVNSLPPFANCVFISHPHRNVFPRQKPFHVADGVGAEVENAGGEDVVCLPIHLSQSFSVGVKGRPRSPLNSFFSRRSLELLLRRMISGATRLPISRRYRRPFNQSSQLIEPSIGMQGTFDFEFIGDFFHQLLTLWKITIFRPFFKRRRRGIFVETRPI